ncbi:MAG: hypothetical protein R2795_18660 [Saprospiraceae bacterium]
MHYRLPDAEKGEITSVCIKDFLKVTGTGQHTLSKLVAQSFRARMQEARLRISFADRWDEVLPQGEVLLLEPIGNHCRGTTFLNGNHLINDSMRQMFDTINHSLTGIYYCRYDMKCESMESLYTGKGIYIVEINGVGADPAHVYDPTYPMRQIYKDLFAHWQIIYRIACKQMSRGVRPMTLAEIRQAWVTYQHHHKLAVKKG